MVAHGIGLQNYFIRETSFLGAVGPSSASAIPLSECRIKPAREYMDIEEYRRTAEPLGWIPGKITGTWSAKGQLRIANTVTNTPPHGELIANAFAYVPIAGGSSRFWVPVANFAGAPTSHTLVQATSQVGQGGTYTQALHQARGCVATKLTFSMEPGEAAMIEAEGEFADYSYMMGTPTVSATVATGVSTVPLTSGDGSKIRFGERGFFVKFGSNDNGGAGYRVTAFDSSVPNVTIAPAVAGSALTSGDRMEPFMPAESYSSSSTVLDGITANLDIGGTDYSMNKCKIEFDTGRSLLNKAATSAVATAMGQGKRDWGGTITVYAENETSFVQGQAFDGQEYAVEIRFGGSTAGTRMRFDFPAARFEVIEEIPFEMEDEGTEIELAFKARATSGNNTCTITQD